MKEKNMNAKNQYRYRDVRGSTRLSLQVIEKHLHKIGQLRYVRGIFAGTYNGVPNPWYRVIIRGESGTMMLKGFSWGYGGEGPRGLETLLIKLGLNPFQVADITSKALNDDTTTGAVNGVKEIWRYDAKTQQVSGMFRPGIRI